MHRPDLPLTLGGDARIGLGLWNSIPGTLAVELAMLAVGVWLYVRATRARDRIGGIGFVAFAWFLTTIYASAGFGPTPPSATAVAWSDMGQWLLIALAAWVDSHRVRA